MSTTEHERYEILLVKAVDGVISPQESQELDAHLPGCASCRQELEDFVQIKAATDAMAARILSDAAIEAPREPPGVKRALGAAFLLLLVGALLLIGFAAYSLFSDAAVPLVIKAGTAALGLGVLLLLGHVLRIRARALKRDPYEEIDR